MVAVMLFNCYMGIMYVTECTPVKKTTLNCLTSVFDQNRETRYVSIYVSEYMEGQIKRCQLMFSNVVHAFQNQPHHQC